MWTINLNQTGKPGAISVKGTFFFKKIVLINNSTFYTLSDPGHVQLRWCESGVGESKTATMHSKATNDNLTPANRNPGQGFQCLSFDCFHCVNTLYRFFSSTHSLAIFAKLSRNHIPLENMFPKNRP